jgi:primosomal protein N' (replication factor Y)
MIIKVSIINVPINSAFDYLVPEELERKIRVGQLITAPFNTYLAYGVVIELNVPHSVFELLPIRSICQDEPYVSKEMVSVALSVSDHFLCPISKLIEMTLPTRFSEFAEFEYSLLNAQWVERKSQIEQQILLFINGKGVVNGNKIEKQFPTVKTKPILSMLVKANLLQRAPRLPKAVARTKYVKTAAIAISRQTFYEHENDLGKTPVTNERRRMALEYLFDEGIPVAVNWVYASSGCNKADLDELADREYIVLSEVEIFRDPLERVNHRSLGYGQPADLTSDAAAKETLQVMLDSQAKSSDIKPSFLYQKSDQKSSDSVYLRVVENAINEGRSAMVLAPEMAFTPKLVRLFSLKFPGLVGLFHSGMSNGEKYDTWMRVYSGKIKIIVGTMSALFLPINDLGVIILEECHDSSYRSAFSPIFDSIYVAEKLKKQFNTLNIYSSQTLPIELLYKEKYNISDQKTGLLKLLPSLPTAFETDLEIKLIDMRLELKTGNRDVLSRGLQESLRQSLANGEQAILFLNRRGDSTYVFCRDCGQSLRCENCDSVLVEHKMENSRSTMLLCHSCGFNMIKPEKCPKCDSKSIQSYGLGVEKLEEKCKGLFPTARILRWDLDSAKSEVLDELALVHFANHSADILIGTQMMAKKYQFPQVTTIGLVLADVGLSLPDPFVNERIFQLYYEIIHLAGKQAKTRVYIQTFQPENELLRLITNIEPAEFFGWEVQNRFRLNLPPFCSLINLEYHHSDQNSAKYDAYQIAGVLRSKLSAIGDEKAEVIGPVPAYTNIKNPFAGWRILLKNVKIEMIKELDLGQGWKIDVDPITI